MKHRKQQCPLLPVKGKDVCPLEGPMHSSGRSPEPPAMVVVRTERRSWFTLAITGFGALLLRYLRTVRERASTVRRKQ
jgi:hypothetical protein